MHHLNELLEKLYTLKPEERQDLLDLLTAVAFRHCAELPKSAFLNHDNSLGNEKTVILSEEEVRKRREMLEVPDTFEEWNKQFKDSSEEYLNSYSEEHGMTVRDFRMMIYESENEMVKNPKGLMNLEEYKADMKTYLEILNGQKQRI